MMNTKYYNDAIIGNKNMVVSYSKTGEMLRVLYPNADYRQFIEFFRVGIKLNDSRLIYLHNDINNVYKQYYVEDTNILKTEIYNTYFNVNITQTDFVMMKENILVRRYEITNHSNIELNTNFLIHSSLLTNNNNQVSGYETSNTLIQYTHDYNFCIFSKEKLLSSQINNVKENITDGVIWDKDYIGMSNDSAISYDLGTIKVNQTKRIEIFVFIQENNEKYNINEIENDIERIKKIDVQKEYDSVKKYWRKYVKDHKKIDIKLDRTNPYNNRVERIYNRTILLYPLLTNYSTGGISAGIEVDEAKTKCGRYSYCWPRDAIFIAKAMDLLGMENITEKFYKNFCKNTQSKSGMWEQRFFTDGRLAPSWGYQIDETASVVYGVYQHYLYTKDIKFLKDTLKMCEKAVEYLKKYMDDILEQKYQMPKSYDIWEENEGIHAYSLTSIFAAFTSMIKINETIIPIFENNRIKLEKIRKTNDTLEKYRLNIKEYVINNFYDESKGSFVRNKDGKMDISLLGLVYPYKMLSPKEKKITNTIEKMNLTLRTYKGGYLRYEQDNYLGGNNPWVISNLWLANYYLESGENKKAKESFDYVVTTSLENGLLGEQINNQTMQPEWVIGLGWSHAMFIITLERFHEKGLI